MKMSDEREKKIKNNKWILYLLLISACFMIICLWIYTRYQRIFEYLDIFVPSPFFMEQYTFSDFYDPIEYVKNLDPYSAKWGNSPPFMMFIAYIFSKIINAGISLYVAYGVYWIIGSAMIGCIVYSISQIYNWNKAESIFLAVLSVGSFPFVYCFDRGNYVFLVAVMMACFIMCYEKERHYGAAVFVGLAAALKLYPALLGIIFVAEKRWKESVVCATTGVVASIGTMLCYKGGFIRNLSLFLEKSSSYSSIGNEILAWLVDDKNSMYQLFLVPKMLSDNPLTSIEQVPEFTAGIKILLTGLLIVVVISCLILKRNHDKVLILTMMMLGYPIESGVYNLVIAVVPIVWWCVKEEKDKVIPVLGVLLISMKSIFVLQTTPVLITLQALMNPCLELMIILYIMWLRRDELCLIFRRKEYGEKR